MPVVREASGVSQRCGVESGTAWRESVRGSGAVVGGGRIGSLRGGSCEDVWGRAGAWCRPRGWESSRSP